MATCSDETLLAQVGTGDHTAFALLYDRVAAAVYGLVRQIVVDVPVADRVAENVLLAVWTVAASFDGSAGSARGWILGMAHRHAVEEIRRHEGLARLTAAADVPPPYAASAEAIGGMEQVLRGLSAAQRSAVELAYFHGLTYRQVARTLDISRSSATDVLRDALRGLAAEADFAPTETAG